MWPPRKTIRASACIDYVIDFLARYKYNYCITSQYIEYQSVHSDEVWCEWSTWQLSESVMCSIILRICTSLHLARNTKSPQNCNSTVEHGSLVRLHLFVKTIISWFFTLWVCIQLKTCKGENQRWIADICGWRWHWRYYCGWGPAIAQCNSNANQFQRRKRTANHIDRYIYIYIYGPGPLRPVTAHNQCWLKPRSHSTDHAGHNPYSIMTPSEILSLKYLFDSATETIRLLNYTWDSMTSGYRGRVYIGRAARPSSCVTLCGFTLCLENIMFTLRRSGMTCKCSHNIDSIDREIKDKVKSFISLKFRIIQQTFIL